MEASTVIAAVAGYYGVPVETFRHPRSGAQSRDVAAWLARKWTTATLRALTQPLGLSHPDSVSNLVRRVERAVQASSRLRADIKGIESGLLKTENRV
jgi:chromosomal replication initiation ATPase DnaA